MITSLSSDSLVEILYRTDCSFSLREVCKTFDEFFFPAFFKACESSPLLTERADRITLSLPNSSAQEKVKALCQSLIEEVLSLSNTNTPKKQTDGDRMLSLEKLNGLESVIEDDALMKVCTAIAKFKWNSPIVACLNEIQHQKGLASQAQAIRKWMNENPTKMADIDIVYLTSDWTKSFLRMGLPKLPKEMSLLTQVRQLHLYDCGLSNLPAGINQLTFLKGLRLDLNCLTSLPNKISQLTQLEHFTICDTPLANFPTEICHLNKLKYLSLCRNKLSHLPLEIGQLNQLEDLHLVNNQLTSLPLTIYQLTSLTFLNLRNDSQSVWDHEKIRLTDKQIVHLPHLKKIHLRDDTIGGNQLTSLPADIGLLTRLHVLWLDNNKLSALPEEIEQLTNLMELSLAGNPLKSLPSQISRLTQLKRLILDQEQLTHLLTDRQKE